MLDILPFVVFMVRIRSFALDSSVCGADLSMGGDDYFPILASFFFSRYWPTIRLDIVLTPQVLPKVLLQAAATCLDLPLNSQSHIVENVEGARKMFYT